jgi:hypothetical protein
VIEVLLSFIARVDPALTQVERLESVRRFSDLGARYHNQPGDDELNESEGSAAAAASVPEWSDVPVTHRRRPTEDDASEQTATRRSFHVMQILCGQRQSQSLMAVLMPKIPAVVLQLLSVFHPASKGNFYHACAVLQKLLPVFPGTVLTTLCSPSVHQPRHIHYLHPYPFLVSRCDDWFAAPVVTLSCLTINHTPLFLTF